MKQNTIQPIFTARGMAAALFALMLAACSPDSPQREQDRAEDHYQRALTYRDEQNYNAAVIELKNALSLATRHQQSRRLLGEIYLAMGDGESAEKELRNALAAGVPKQTLLLPLGEALLRTGQSDKLLQEIRPNPSLGREDQARIYALRGSAHIYQNDRNAAREDFIKALELDPRLAPALLGQAALAMGDGRQATARQLIGQAIKHTKGSDAAEAWRTLAELERIQGDLSAAEAAYSRSIELTHSPGALLIKRIQVRIDKRDYAGATQDLDQLSLLEPNNPQILYGRGLLAVRQGLYPEAQAQLEQFHNRQPEHLHGQFYLGVAHYAQGHTKEAEKHLHQVVQRMPRAISARWLLAQTRMALGDYQSAVELLEPIQRAQPENPELLASLGSLYLKLGQIKRSRYLLEQALIYQSGVAETRVRLGFDLLKHGQTELGLRQLEQMAAQDPKSLQLQTMLTLGLLQAGEIARAEAQAKKLSENSPRTAAPLNLLGLVYIAKGDGEAAESAFRQVLQQQPDSLVATVNLAGLSVSRGDLEQARTLYQKALRLQPDHLQTAMALIRLEQRAGNPGLAKELAESVIAQHPLALEPRVWMASSLLRENKPAGVTALFEPVREHYPNNPKVLTAVGEAQLATNKIPEAMKTAEALTRAAPMRAESHYFRARVCAVQGSLKCLSEALEEGLLLAPEDKRVLPLVQRMLQLSGSDTISSRLLWKLEDAAPGLTALSDLRARNAMALENPELAAKIYTRLTEANPDNWDWRRQLVLAQAAAGELSAAKQTLDDWLMVRPDDEQALFLLANVHTRLGDQASAIAVYEQLRENFPDSPTLLNNLAWLLRERKPDAALGYAEQAVALQPNYRNNDTLGVILLARGEPERAVELLQRAFGEQPDDPLVQLHLAQGLAAQGETAQARALLSELLAEANTDFAERPEAEALMARLGEK